MYLFSFILNIEINCFQDLAIHTRVTPEQRKLTMMKFINAVNKKEEARKELERWGLQLDTSTIEVRNSPATRSV